VAKVTFIPYPQPLIHKR